MAHCRNRVDVNYATRGGYKYLASDETKMTESEATQVIDVHGDETTKIPVRPRDITVSGCNNFLVCVGDKSSFHFTPPDTASRPNQSGGIRSKRKLSIDSVDGSSLKKLRSGREYGLASHSEDSQPSSHPCQLQPQRGTDTRVNRSRGKQKPKPQPQPCEIPNILYNSMKMNLSDPDLLDNGDVHKCIRLLQQDGQGYGLSDEDMGQIESVYDMLDLMEKKCLLSPDNLVLLQFMLHSIKRQRALDVVDGFAAIRNTQPLCLFIIKKGAMVKGRRRVEFRIKGSAKHIKNRKVKAWIKIMATNLGLAPKDFFLQGTGNGSVMLVFLMPETVIAKLRQAVQAKDIWLKECGVLGVHIDGEDYVEIMPTEQKGYIEFCVNCKSSFLQEFFSGLQCVKSANNANYHEYMMDLKQHEQSENKCAGCSQSLNQASLVYHVKNYTYHDKCFVCVECDQSISPADEFFQRSDQKLLCLHDFKLAMAKDVRKLKIFVDVVQNRDTPDTGCHDAYTQTATDQACQTDLPVIDISDNQIQHLASQLTERQWQKVSTNLRLTLLSRDPGSGNTVYEKLIAWKQRAQVYEVGFEANEQLATVLCGAKRCDLASYIFPDHTSTLLKDFAVQQYLQDLGKYYLQELCKFSSFPASETVIDFDEIYTALAVSRDSPSQGKVPLQSYADILSGGCNRILIRGSVGSGKSTLAAKIAYDWAREVTDSPVEDVLMTIVLSMKDVDYSTNIEDAVISQLLPEDTNVKAKQLKEYMTTHSSKLVLIFDGFDEVPSNNVSCVEKGSVMKAIASEILQDCCIVVTTRLMSLDYELEKHYTTFEIHGFSDDSVQKYIRKFFAEDSGRGEKLEYYLSNSDILPSITFNPLILHVLCVLWQESGDICAIRTGDLYNTILEKISSRRDHCDVNSIISQLGQIAIDGLWSPVYTHSRNLYTSAVLEEACKIGLMVKQTSTKRNEMGHTYSAHVTLVQPNNVNHLLDRGEADSEEVTFFQKTFQEKCAGDYLATLAEYSPEAFMIYFKAKNDVLNVLGVQFVFRFACSASPNAAGKILHGLLEIYTSQLEHLIPKYYEEKLSFQEARTMHEFIILCLVCNYEADAMGQFNSLLTQLVPTGKLELFDVSDYSAVAIGYFISHIQPGVLHSLKLQAVPRLDKTVEPDEFLKSVQHGYCRGLKMISKDIAYKLAVQCLDKYEFGRFQIYQMMARQTPLKLLAYTGICQLSRFLPSETPYTIEPVINSIQFIQLKSFDISGFKDKRKNEHLLDIIEKRLLPCLTKLKLSDLSLNGEQMKRVAAALGHFPNLKVLDLSCNEAGHGLPILGESLIRLELLKVLDIRHMQASAEDVLALLERFPNFRFSLVKLYISGNQMNDAVIHAFLKNVPKPCGLEDLEISLGGVSQLYHRLLLKEIQDYKCLKVLTLKQSAFPDDLLLLVGDLFETVSEIKMVCLEVDIGASPQITHSTWVDFKGKLQQASKLKQLFLYHIALEESDFSELIEIGNRLKFKCLRYYTNCLPNETTIIPDNDFLELL